MRLLRAAFCAAAVCVGSASAAPIIYFGENQTPGGAVSGAPLTARNAFNAQLVGVSTESFESLALGTLAPVSLSFTGSAGLLTADLTGVGTVRSAPDTGRFNTSPGGDRFWRVSGTFDISFGTAVSAFGFYGTDIGDFEGSITVALTDINDIVTNFVVPNTIDGENASLLFWGFIDSGNSYKSISFGNTNAGTDIFGFDDMVIGDREQIKEVPVPTTLALLGLGLLGLAAARRRAG